MHSSLLLLSLSSLAVVSAVLLPPKAYQQALINKKPLVTSEGIQSHVSPKRLLKSAEDLFELAELSIEEYAHPTRVIGSLGMPIMLSQRVQITDLST
jgi:aminopeptidase Y